MIQGYQCIVRNLGLIGLCSSCLGSILWATDALFLSSLLSVESENELLLGGLLLLGTGFVSGFLDRFTRLGKFAIAMAILSPIWLVLGLLRNPYGIGPGGHS